LVKVFILTGALDKKLLYSYDLKTLSPRVNVHTAFILMFLSFHRLVELSIAQLVENCSANAEAMDSNPVEALKFLP